MNRLFITGGGGYVGSVLIPKLLTKQYEVTVLDLFLYGADVLPKHNNLKLIKGDIRDISLLNHSLTSQDGIKGTLASIFYGADVIERHFTILPPSETKDGPVSISPKNVMELKKFSQLTQEKMRDKLQNIFPLFHLTLGSEHRDLSKTEMKNRDYFRGRFINKVSKDTFYNWEKY